MRSGEEPMALGAWLYFAWEQQCDFVEESKLSVVVIAAQAAAALPCHTTLHLRSGNSNDMFGRLWL